MYSKQEVQSRTYATHFLSSASETTRTNKWSITLRSETFICINLSQMKTPTWCNTVQVLFLQGHSTCFGRKRLSSGVFKTRTAATGTCVIVAGKSSHLLIRAGGPNKEMWWLTYRFKIRHIVRHNFKVTWERFTQIGTSFITYMNMKCTVRSSNGPSVIAIKTKAN